MKSNIVLCGFMGCGKSTVGKIVAKRLDMSFIDGDTYIEQKENKTVSQIFADNGEDYFRSAEKTAMKELAQKRAVVIATGGGAVMNPDNAEALKKTGVLVFIDVLPETVIKRLENDTSRPLLQRPDRKKAVTELMEKRYPVYRSVSDYSVNGNLDAESTADAIIEQYKKIHEFE